jgi:hypothetical protein
MTRIETSRTLSVVKVRMAIIVIRLFFVSGLFVRSYYCNLNPNKSKGGANRLSFF